MPTANEIILDAAIEHSIDTLRYSNGVVRRLIALLNRSDNDLNEQIIAALQRLPAESFTVERLDMLLADVRRINEAAYQQLRAGLDGELKELVSYEAGYQMQLFQSVLPVQVSVAAVSVEQVYSAALARPMQSRLLKEWASGIEADKMTRIRDALRMGYVEGQTIQQMVQRIRGTKARGYEDGIIQVDRRNAEAVVRTAIAHTAGFTRDRFIEANASVIAATVWISTLDIRTTKAICVPRDGKKYDPVTHKPIGHSMPWGSGPGRAHWNCLPGSSLVSVRGNITRAYKRPYKGQLFIIKTASGREISCTPNHPILSDRGWIAAQSFNLGDNVISDGFIQGEFPINSENDNVPSSIEEIAESFFVSSAVTAVEVPISAPDFHGDGIGSQVAVVGTNSSLFVDFDSPIREHIGEYGFSNGHSLVKSGFASHGGLDLGCHLNDSSSGSNVSGPSNCRPFFGACLGHSGELLFASISQRDASLFECQPCSRNGNIKQLSDAANAYSVIEDGPRLGYVKPLDGSLEPPVVGDAFTPTNTAGFHDSNNHFVGNFEHSGNFGNAISSVMEVGNLNNGDVNNATVRSNSIGLHDVNNVRDRHVESGGDCRGKQAIIGHGNDVADNLVSGELHLLNSSPDSDAIVSEDGFNRISGCSKHSANLLNPATFGVQGDNGGTIEIDTPVDYSTGRIEPVIDGSDVDSQIARNILNGNSGPVFIDNIVSIEVSEFDGHVYNLETDCGWFVADGIVTHNCRSSSYGALKSWKSLGIDMDELPDSVRSSMDGTVPESTTYLDWIKKQSAGRQDDILGPTRGKLLRGGSLPVEQLYDHKGKWLTLDQLREKNAEAFNRAGV